MKIKNKKKQSTVEKNSGGAWGDVEHSGHPGRAKRTF